VSGQILNSFIFNNDKYGVCAVEFWDTFFRISSLGINPKKTNTANILGYVATFCVDDNCLYLENLLTNTENNLIDETPIINNRQAVVVNDLFGKFYYDNIQLLLPYTGSLLISKDFIHSMYVHMGWQLTDCYETILQLTFHNGKLTSFLDLSDFVSSIRTFNLKFGEQDVKQIPLLQDWMRLYIKSH